MSIETALYAEMVADTGIAALVSTRVYPVQLPQSPTLPAITYQRISGSRTYVMGQPSINANPRFQITSWGATYSSAQSVAAAIRALLDGFKGELGSDKHAGVRLVNDYDISDPETGRYGIAADYIIWHQE